MSGVDCSAHGVQRGTQVDVGPSPPALSERAFAQGGRGARADSAAARQRDRRLARPLWADEHRHAQRRAAVALVELARDAQQDLAAGAAGAERSAEPADGPTDRLSARRLLAAVGEDERQAGQRARRLGER